MKKKELDDFMKMFIIGWLIMVYMLLSTEDWFLSGLVSLAVLIPVVLITGYQRSQLKD